MDTKKRKNELGRLIGQQTGQGTSNERTTIRLAVSQDVREAIALEARFENRTMSGWLINVIMEELHRREYC